MGFYQISDLEQLSGIKAHTIRIWEKRYKLIKPHRTTTNIRYYDDEQARKLLNVVTLLANGGKISHISKLSTDEIAAQIKQCQEHLSEDNSSTAFVNSLVVSMLDFDETGFDKVFSAAITRLGVYNAMLKVFYPFLHKTGIFWSTGDAYPAQEHFASNIIRRKLLAAIDGLIPVKKNGKKMLLFLPPNELHEIALLFSDYILRFNGFDTIYLGQNVPYENLNEVIMKIRPEFLLTFYISRNSADNIHEKLQSLLKQYKNIEILVSGNQELLKPLKLTKRLIIVKSPEELLKLT